MIARIDQTTMSILSALDVAANKVRITEQLDRKTYEAVNKVLELLGGTWSRKDKAHVFTGDAAPLIDQAITTGIVDKETARDVGWFPTPVALATKLVALADVRPDMRCLEPSAGTGRIVDALLRARGDVWAVERDSERRQMLISMANGCSLHVVDCVDFMSYLPMYGGNGGRKRFDRVVMNPPFAKVGEGDHLDHVRHAFDMLESGGILVSVLPSSITFRRDKRHSDFRVWVNTYGNIEPLPPQSFKESKTDVNTVTIRMVAP